MKPLETEKILNNVEVVEVKFKALAGTDIYTCINECISFSAINEIPCTLTHNGVEITVSAFDLCNKLQKEWEGRLKNKK